MAREVDWVSLIGDGRLRVQPEPGVEYLGNPQFMSWGYAKQLLKLVKQGEESVHSPAGGTVWIVQKWARLNGRALHVEMQFDCKGKLMGYICQVTP